MLFRILDNLREKPEPVRKQAAFLFSSAIFVVILLVWIVVPGKFGDKGNEEASDATSPFSIFKEQGKVIYESASEQVSTARDAFSGATLPAAAVLLPSEDTVDSGNATSDAHVSETATDPDLFGDSILDGEAPRGEQYTAGTTTGTLPQ